MEEYSVTRLVPDIFELGESPRWSGILGGLIFTDINSRKLWLYKDGVLKLLNTGNRITSFLEELDGTLICGTFDGLYKFSTDGKFIPMITEQHRGMPLKINDMCADPAGRAVFGTNFHTGGLRFPLGSLYCYDNSVLRELDYGYQLINGIGFSVDGRIMYVCDSAIRTIFEYDYDPKSGTVNNKRVFARLRVDDGIPDGMTIDADGNIYTAQWYGKCVICFAPDGTELFRIAMPEWQISAVELASGGLFVTSASERGRLDIAPSTFHEDTPGNGGGLFFVSLPNVNCKPHRHSGILGVYNCRVKNAGSVVLKDQPF